ncbi:YceI family protein [Chryseolinea soli]|uniref:YceI family protein n=1 Tax=Chryseolinea soli TaxID=2321403 RepID=A0A385SMZ2_9BACT|nr:YceI family protein [Chryseolinea soli]AYB30358.1 YceI family protein [Chryseolinea soli]
MKSYRNSNVILACFVILALSSFTAGPGKSEFLMVDTKQSTVAWTGYYAFNFNEHTGTIRLTKGEIEVADNRITGGFFELDMNSIEDVDMRGESSAKDLEDHLKSDDFFSVAQYPSARFTITKTKELKDGPNFPNYEITGTLTLKGITNTLTFPATVELKDGQLQATAKLKFDRTRWNVRYNSGKIFSSIGDGAISDAIALEIHLKANGC